MAHSSILIALDDLPSFSPQFRAELRDYAFRQAEPETAPTGSAAVDDDDEGELALLGVRQARRLVAGCSPKTRSVLEEIIRLGGTFNLPALAATFDTSPGGLGGVWGGLTKRVRTVTGDDEAVLIDWTWDEDQWRGALAPVTLASLRKALESN